MKRTGLSIFLLSILNICVAQDINIKNDTGDDLYIALVKALDITMGEFGSILYRDRDNVRILGDGGGGRLKAGASGIIRNFPWTHKEVYSNILWVAKTAKDLQAEITARKSDNNAIAYATNNERVKVRAFIGTSSGLPGMVGFPMGDVLKIRIFKISDGENKGQYSYEYIWPDDQTPY